MTTLFERNEDRVTGFLKRTDFSWEIFLKKNKKNSMLTRDFRVKTIT